MPVITALDINLTLSQYIEPVCSIAFIFVHKLCVAATLVASMILQLELLYDTST